MGKTFLHDLIKDCKVTQNLFGMFVLVKDTRILKVSILK